MREQDDVMAEEKDAQNLPVIENLQRIYPPRSDAAQSLARVHHTLYAAKNDLEHVDASMRAWSNAQPAISHAQVMRPVSPINRVSRSLFTSIGAVIVVALLVGSFLVVAGRLSQHAGHPAGNITPTATNVPPSVVGVGRWYRVAMFNATTGWAIAANGLLRTTDGGAHWQAVAQCYPQALASGSNSLCLAFADSATSATLATIVMDGKQFKGTRITHTSDDGLTWHNAIIDAEVIVPVDFVDALHGWVMTTSGGGKLLTLFRTLDDGETWQPVSPGPRIDSISGMTFRDASTGWITSTIKTNVDTSGIMRTHDGGQTWQAVPLSFPANSGISPIVFFNQQEGLFLLNTTIGPGHDHISTTIYVTYDGGKTWISRGSAPYYLDPADFIDLNYAWVQSPNPQEKAIYTSSDGGLHWSRIPIQAPFTNILSLSFVSPTLGFALATNGGYPGNGADGLFKTIDGGHTWQEIVRLNQGL